MRTLQTDVNGFHVCSSMETSVVYKVNSGYANSGHLRIADTSVSNNCDIYVT